MIRRMSEKTAGMIIWNAVTMMRRFCSSQFFHNSSPNCAAFDIAMLLSVNDALQYVYRVRFQPQEIRNENAINFRANENVTENFQVSAR